MMIYLVNLKMFRFVSIRFFLLKKIIIFINLDDDDDEENERKKQEKMEESLEYKLWKAMVEVSLNLINRKNKISH